MRLYRLEFFVEIPEKRLREIDRPLDQSAVALHFLDGLQWLTGETEVTLASIRLFRALPTEARGRVLVKP